MHECDGDKKSVIPNRIGNKASKVKISNYSFHHWTRTLHVWCFQASNSKYAKQMCWTSKGCINSHKLFSLSLYLWWHPKISQRNVPSPSSHSLHLYQALSLKTEFSYISCNLIQSLSHFFIFCPILRRNLTRSDQKRKRHTLQRKTLGQ